MKFKFAHNNLNVMDMNRSLAFYREALGLVPHHSMKAPGGSFELVYLTDGVMPHLLELTCLKEWGKDHYDLGDNEIHLAFTVDDMEAARKKHREMGCICFENKELGIYFIEDPDGYWLEIIPES